jgi:hypothetical protein
MRIIVPRAGGPLCPSESVPRLATRTAPNLCFAIPRASLLESPVHRDLHNLRTLARAFDRTSRAPRPREPTSDTATSSPGKLLREGVDQPLREGRVGGPARGFLVRPRCDSDSVAATLMHRQPANLLLAHTPVNGLTNAPARLLSPHSVLNGLARREIEFRERTPPRFLTLTV